MNSVAIMVLFLQPQCMEALWAPSPCTLMGSQRCRWVGDGGNRVPSEPLLDTEQHQHRMKSHPLPCEGGGDKKPSCSQTGAHFRAAG